MIVGPIETVIVLIPAAFAFTLLHAITNWRRYRLKHWIAVSIHLALALPMGILVLSALKAHSSSVDAFTAQQELSTLRVLLSFHDIETGEMMVGGNAEIMESLGRIESDVLQSYFQELRFNDRGESVDPWGTPYRFTHRSEGPPEILSAGPDLKFGTSDDIP